MHRRIVTFSPGWESHSIPSPLFVLGAHFIQFGTQKWGGRVGGCQVKNLYITEWVFPIINVIFLAGLKKVPFWSKLRARRGRTISARAPHFDNKMIENKFQADTPTPPTQYSSTSPCNQRVVLWRGLSTNIDGY
jgi:hypothetical protein